MNPMDLVVMNPLKCTKYTYVLTVRSNKPLEKINTFGRGRINFVESSGTPEFSSTEVVGSGSQVGKKERRVLANT